MGVISWTPEGFFGWMLATIRPYRSSLSPAVPPAAKNHYGPTIEAYANVGHNRVLAAELDAQLVELARQYLSDGTMHWEYLLATCEKL